MMVLLHFDWHGTQEELEKFTAAFKKACEATKGAKFLGRHIPLNKKYHYTMFYEVTGWPIFEELGKNMTYKRDYKNLTHGEYEYYQ